MQPLNLPPCALRTQQRDGQTYVYDFLRRRYIRLTPEEWVRQHFTHFLVHHKHYPAALLANEVTISVCGVARRCDSVLYDSNARPRMIVEYKAPTVAITQQTFNQIEVYNLLLKVDYLVVSNGMQHYCCKMDYERCSYAFLKDIPDYAVL